MVPVRSNLARRRLSRSGDRPGRPRPAEAASNPGEHPKASLRAAAVKAASRLALAAALLLGGLGSRLPAQPADDLLDRWFAAQSRLVTWSADLTQTRSLTMLAQPLVSSGKVWIQAPDRFRLELGQPAQTIAIRQPEQLLILYPRLKRAEKYPLTHVPPGPWKDALALLETSFPRNRATLEAAFQVVSVTETNSIARVALHPRSASARKFMTDIFIGFRTTDFSLVSTELRFADGSSMRNDFTNAVLNPVLAPDQFEAKLPAEFTVVEPLKQ